MRHDPAFGFQHLADGLKYYLSKYSTNIDHSKIECGQHI